MASYKDSVRVATTDSIALTGIPQPIDGVTVTDAAGGDRVLVKDQTNPAENGIYTVSTGAWLRAADANSSSLMTPEAGVRVSEGILNRNTEWVMTTIAPITLGTTALTYTKSWASKDDAAYYVSSSLFASDTFDGLSPGTAFATIQHALVALGYTQGAYFAYTVAVTNGSTAITFASAQTIPAGTPITFTSQPGVFYYIATNVTSNISGTLTIAYSGTTNPVTIAQPGVGNPGCIRLLGGTFVTPAGGLALGPRQSIEGCGATASKIIGTTVTSGDGNAVLTLNGSRSSACNLWIQNLANNAVGLRLGIAVTGTNENSLIENIHCENQPSILGDSISIAFGVGDITTGDVSDCVMINCTSVTAHTTSGIGMKIGAGTGNVLDMTIIGGVHYGNQYGIMIDGGSAVFTGVNFSYNGSLGRPGADIFLFRTAIGSVSFNGGRSENSLRFVVSNFGNFALPTNISNYMVVGLRNTDGQGIQLSSGLVVLDNIALLGLTCPQYIFQPSRPDLDYPFNLDIRNLASEHPFPLGSPWVRGNQINVTRGIRFCGDTGFQIRSRCTTSDLRIKRHNVVTSGANWTLDPIFCDMYIVRLSAAAGTFMLLPGSLGKIITICFEQDGLGGWTWTWPTNIAWSGGSAPGNVTTSRNRQSCDLQWSGSCWGQCGPIMNTVPVAAASNPITDNFSGSVGNSANPYWLNYPDTVGTTTRWEHVPGGGSLGVLGGKCITNCLGLSGDNDLDLAPGNAGLAAIKAAWAVIETGMATQTTGISATFTWQLAEGIVAHYLDDQTFVLLYVTSTTINLRGYTHGVPMVGVRNLTHGVTMIPGSTHTLLVKCTSTGFVVNLDSGVFTIAITLNTTDLANFNDLTKHGIFSTSIAATFTQFRVS